MTDGKGTAMILCGGDALIDFVPFAGPGGETAFLPRVGGAVLNAATALGRLGQEVEFVGALSSDLFEPLTVSSCSPTSLRVAFSSQRLRPFPV